MNETSGAQRGVESANTTRRWSTAEVQALGLTTDLVTAASILGIGRTKAYELVHADAFPVRVIRVGRRIVVPVALLLELLGCEPRPE